MVKLSTLCYIEQDGKYLMLHRTVKENDINKDKWIGVGGHFEKGESPEECLLREVKEETGLTISSYEFNDNEYYARTNTYINNYIVVVEDESFHCNEEIDYAKWYDLKDAMNIIKPDSLAQELLRRYLYKREHNLVFTR